MTHISSFSSFGIWAIHPDVLSIFLFDSIRFLYFLSCSFSFSFKFSSLETVSASGRIFFRVLGKVKICCVHLLEKSCFSICGFAGAFYEIESQRIIQPRKSFVCSVANNLTTRCRLLISMAGLFQPAGSC